MNITLLGHNDIASLYALNRVIQQLPEHRHTALLSSAPAIDATSTSPLAELARADAALCDRFLSGKLIGPVAAALTDGAVERLDKPNSQDGLAVLRNLRAGLVLSIRYRRILRHDAIALPRFGVLNLHSGILPEYRGVMATFWAMRNSEEEIGTTLHWIVDSGVDTGPVIGIQRRATRMDRSYLTNTLGLYANGCDMMVEAVRSVAAGDLLPGIAQAGTGHYFHAPGDDDVRCFESQGLALADGREMREICAND